MGHRHNLPYNPEQLERELSRFYISASATERQEMLDSLGLKKIEEVFAGMSPDIFFKKDLGLGAELSYDALLDHLSAIASKNKLKTSFIGDGLKDYQVPEIVSYVCNIRGLTTAYTPYQPERSQGTLYTLWLYSSMISTLTGFEAVNASLYDRSTCLFEAMNTISRLAKGKNKIIVASTLYPGDIEVLHTLAAETQLKVIVAPLCPTSGSVDLKALDQLCQEHLEDLAGIAFPQLNHLGVLEDVHALTDLAQQHNLKTIGVIDPILLAKDALARPNTWGSKGLGVDVIVGEGQHLCLGPNFGGPGLGIFGIRYNEADKNSIRQTAGRYVGKGQDEAGNPALCMVLSTREQHIRREKATSNICSNQSFVATIAGAAILERGEEGLSQSAQKGHDQARLFLASALKCEGVELAFSEAPFYNEVALEVNKSVSALIESARAHDLHIGVDISERVADGRQILLISFFDRHSSSEIEKLIKFFQSEFKAATTAHPLPAIPANFLNHEACGVPKIALAELKKFYDQLGQLNVSPDDAIYPLGSCTMKYNPYINDWAAGLPGFTNSHPQAPLADVQGSLQILFEIQEDFKKITGLAAVTTQPVAGAQGELVGLKMFQAYHRDRGEALSRNIVLIPKSAHGTNPATATMAGFETKKQNGTQFGIVEVSAYANGEMNIEHVRELIEKYGERISGVMVTNPNTSGVFESKFKEMAEMIHEVGGLVYMDGANMNAIAGHVDLNALGVDAVHNNLHKTWTIPHGGGGPGDAIVAVSERLVSYLPGIQVVKKGESYDVVHPSHSMGSIHRHYGNFAHKVRAYTYVKALGTEGVREMSAFAVLSAQYLFKKLKNSFPTLPADVNTPRMHEFILTLTPETFKRIEEAGTPKANAIARIGKLFLDFGLHAPTVAFPEQYGLMIEPTESFTKAELDRFCEVVEAIHTMIHDHPEVLATAPHFTPVKKVNEVEANKNLVLCEQVKALPKLPKNIINPKELGAMSMPAICEQILMAHKQRA